MVTDKGKNRYATLAQADVPQGRNGKHKKTISRILEELAELKTGDALKIPIAELSDSKENIRSALTRACHQLNRPLATASDTTCLYVWGTTT